jgi:hypothetical protein
MKWSLLRSSCAPDALGAVMSFVVDPHYAFFPHGGAQAAPRASLPQLDAPSWGMPMSSSDGGASLQHQSAPDRQYGTYDAEVMAQSLDEEFVTEYIC